MNKRCIHSQSVGQKINQYYYASNGWYTMNNIRSRLDRSVELHANAFRENDVYSMRVNESEVV